VGSTGVAARSHLDDPAARAEAGHAEPGGLARVWVPMALSELDGLDDDPA
jgi:hypothetical protein